MSTTNSYCHACGREVRTDHMRCGDCGSEFIEWNGQNYEDFVAGTVHESSPQNIRIPRRRRGGVILSLRRGGGNDGDTGGRVQLQVGDLLADFLAMFNGMVLSNAHENHSTGTDDVIIESLRRSEVTEETNDSLGECCISMEPFAPGDVCVHLPCGHQFKQEPLERWLRLRNSCPVCREQLPTPHVNASGRNG